MAFVQNKVVFRLQTEILPKRIGSGIRTFEKCCKVTKTDVETKSEPIKLLFVYIQSQRKRQKKNGLLSQYFIQV